MIHRIRGNKSTWVDIDDTLIYWSPTQEQIEKYGIPFSYTYDDGSFRTGTIVPHRAHIEQLRKHAMRGHTIILWSAGGEQWAYAAALALGLHDIVSYTSEKPEWAYDDKKPQEFFDTKWMEDV